MSGFHQDRMIEIPGRVGQTGADILGFQVGEILKDFRLGCAFGQHVQHVLDADAHPPDARPPPTLLGTDSDSIHYARNLLAFAATFKPRHFAQLFPRETSLSPSDYRRQRLSAPRINRSLELYSKTRRYTGEAYGSTLSA
jgi:hypothetical protein